MTQSDGSRAAIFLKPALLLGLLAADLLHWADVYAEWDRDWSLFSVPIKFWLMYLAVFAAAYVRCAWLRWSFAVFLALSTAIVLGAGAVTGVPISFFDFVTMIDARSALPDMYAMHGGIIMWASLPALLALFGVGLSPPAYPKWLDAKTVQVGMILLALVAAGFLIRTVYGTQGAVKAHAAPWLGLSYAALYGYESTQGHVGVREQVALPLSGGPPARDIVLIVDESVAGPYLDLINPDGERSGLLDAGRSWNVANFGITSSMTNCSMATNAGLRFGAQRDDFRRNIALAPSIWAHAQSAGLRTVYMYGQRGGRSENYMTDAEKLDIDEEIYFDGVEASLRDFRIADALAERLNNGVPEFILVNKYGVHFPLKDIVPDENAKQPDMEGAAIIAGGIPLGEEASGPDGWAVYKAAYRRAVSRSVGGFFDHLDAQLAEDAPPFTMIYTSDHGQQFHERGLPGELVHCRKDAVMEEAVVPLAIVENEPAMIDWQQAATANRNRKSHFQIFPSLLRIMGYETNGVRGKYGPDLIDPEEDPQTFASEMHIHFGWEPLWHAVKPACVIMPGAEREVLRRPECRHKRRPY
ncbi:hypothetical protein QWY75_09110 [Pontixanthobacter aestiaquae]|uniref:Sulfatase N-terminal domain-containing protein n=1 Tax=Pontixanthobacter aestiaquae TaxID=1509367 RepID=A0A844Z705_9SPHN|nr:hypothetical protein [Pontixanthobacter aestiaquae]MDN3646358.1 hypothetical protein [Pontixanthobacter aestiaquae]MXO82653.1 hypothetical protein [Pontixanthobacter aestiaquae]